MDPRTANLPANRCKPKEKPILCPFGCARGSVQANINEHGYCRHLVGFSLDKATMEVRCKIGEREQTGPLTEKVLKTDQLVEMATPTFRVYRQDGKAPFVVSPEELETEPESTVVDDPEPVTAK